MPLREAYLTQRGFTLIEALITTVILVTGLTAVASAFSYSSLSNLRIRQQTAAVALVSTKMEALKVAPKLIQGRYSEYFYIGPDGAVMAVDSVNAPYRQTWEINAEVPSRTTVIIYGRQSGRKTTYVELARATTVIGTRF